jgi:molybdate/tungstate transport system substrate-binding protein
VKKDLTSFNVLHAGALRKPIKECIHLLMEKYPGLHVELDYAGSRACAKAVAEGKMVDVIALADHDVFNDILIPAFVDTSFVFATDQMVLAFDEFSPESNNINGSNWMDVLLSHHNVKYTRSDHNLDPCGYRALMLWQLAEVFYNRDGIYTRLNNNCHNLYPKSIDIAVALLEGKVDYGFCYMSVASQMNLKYIQFPPEINLSDPRLADYYARARVTVEGSYAGLETEIRGAPIEFAVAIPKNSNQKELAREFINILTSRQGETILEQNGLIPC